MFKNNVRSDSAGSYSLIILLALLFATAIIPSVNITAQATWSRTYGGDGEDKPSAVIMTSNGGYICAANTTSFGLANAGIWVFKSDYLGNILWQRVFFSGLSSCYVNSIEETDDHGFIIAGAVSTVDAYNDALIMKLDSSGNILWQKSYGSSGGEEATCVRSASDGGYIVAAYSSSFGSGGYDFWLLKLDEQGDIVWENVYGGSGQNEVPCTTVRQTSDGGYVAGGFTGASGGPLDIWVLMIDSSGVVQWQKKYAGSARETASWIEQTSDGGFIIAGSSNSFSMEGDYDVWAFKLDSSGNVQWNKTFGGSGDDFSSSLVPVSGGWVFSCTSNSFSGGDDDYWLVKLDLSGNLLWQRAYYGPAAETARALTTVQPGGILLTGFISFQAAAGTEIWTLKTDRDGYLPGSCELSSDTEAAVNMPAVTAETTYYPSSPVSSSKKDTALQTSFTSGNVNLQCSGTCPQILLSPSVLPGAQVGVEYNQSITASGGNAPYNYALGYTEPPEGLSLSAGGVLSGIPVTSGKFPLLIYAYDYDGCAGSNLYTLSVDGGSCSTITLSPETLPTAIPGIYYDQTIMASGGTAPYTFSLTGGSLPPGLSLAENGTLSGTPSGSGSYGFTVTVTDAAMCQGSHTYTVAVGCDGTTGSLDGYIAVSDEEGAYYYILDGPGVSGTVTATGTQGATFTADISGGYFDFGEIPYGPYSLVATVSYTDHIPYDASLLALGCPSPQNGVVVKNISSPAVFIDVVCEGENSAMVEFEKPVVMLHGMFGCYEKWYRSDPADPELYRYWDNYAREQGVISFTPNYEWWGDNGSWITRAEEVLDQIHRDMASLTTRGVPPFTLVAHDMGGLITRILGSPIYSEDPAVEKIRTAFIIGTPNSGIDMNPRSGKDGLLGPNSIIRYFNDAYPDFGTLHVYAIAGNNGWWGTDNNDGRISLRSAFTITRVACKGADCLAYPALSLDSGFEHVFPYRHKELGSPESVEEIFENVILLTGRSLGQKKERGVPEAPVAGVEWGTVGRSSATMGTRSNSLRGEAAQDYPFTVSNCDGMAVFVTVTSGSGSFKVVDPSGFQHDLEDNAFIQSAPEPGTWILRATPGLSGMTFDAAAVDNSIFGIKAYLTSEYVGEGVKTTIRADRDGDWALVTPSSVRAFIYDSAGNLLQTLDMPDNGGYFSLEFAAPSSTGTYQIVVKAEGTYAGDPFTRVEFETLNVLPSSHYFTGTFSDSPLDRNGDGKFDAISFSADVAIDQSGYFVVSADLFDSDGNFLSHSTASVSADRTSIQAILMFDLKDLNCSQLSSPLEVTGLRVLDADSLRAVDVWGQHVSTQSYSSSQFNCDTSEPAPQVLYVTPSRVVAGTTSNLAIVGRNFDENAIVTFDAGIGKLISVLRKENFENRVIYSTISIPTSAVGHVNVRVTNPDGSDGVLYEVLVSEEDSAPKVSFQDLEDGSVVGGYQDIIANASDDVKVASVSFELDGVLQKNAASFPFIWSWDTSAAAVGTHTVKATATDSAGHQASTQAVVSVVQPPVVAMMNKKGSPFRIVVLGSNLQEDITVYINGEMWTNVAWKSGGKIVIKGGSLLKSRVPKGTPATFTFVNDDGGVKTVVWQW